jgi:hypothetical protein
VKFDAVDFHSNLGSLENTKDLLVKVGGIGALKSTSTSLENDNVSRYILRAMGACMPSRPLALISNCCRFFWRICQLPLGAFTFHLPLGKSWLDCKIKVGCLGESIFSGVDKSCAERLKKLMAKNSMAFIQRL